MTATQHDEPRLAKPWEVAPEGVTWAFHVRQPSALCDGPPGAAGDVLFVKRRES